MGYVWSPLPPSAAPAAAYVEALIGEPEAAGLTLVAERGEERSGRRAVAPDSDARLDDRALLVLANGPEHDFVLDRARLGGAVISLHDLSLHPAHARRTLGTRDFPGYLAGLREADGDWGHRLGLQRQRAYDPARLESALPVNRTLCDRARAVIVQSHWARFQLELQEITTPVHVLAHFAPAIGDAACTVQTREGARAALGLSQDAFVIAAIDTGGPGFRLDWVLDAYEMFREDGADAALLIAGRRPGSRIADRITGSRFADAIHTLDPADAERRDTCLIAADLVTAPEFPSFGASPGVVARALGFGRVVAVADIAAASDLPDAVAEKLDLTRPVPAQILAIAARLAAAPASQAAAEDRARAYAARHLGLAQTRKRLMAILEHAWG